MKRMFCAIPWVLLLAVLISGCGGTLPDADESLVYVNKKGAVTYLDVEAFDPGLYEEEGLREFLEQEIDAYTQEHGKNTVKLSDLSVENGVAKLRLTCQSAQDFAQYNGIEMYQGRVVDALAAGYVFDGAFAKVENGAVTGEATKQEIYKENELKVVIIRANVDVRVEGEICYVSCQNVSLTGPDGVSIRPGYYLGDASVVTGAQAGGQAGGSASAAGGVQTESAGNAVGPTEEPDGGSGGSDAGGEHEDDAKATDDAQGDEKDASGEDGENDSDTAGTEAGMVIDADTSGASDNADGMPQTAGGSETYTFIVYR